MNSNRARETTRHTAKNKRARVKNIGFTTLLTATLLLSNLATTKIATAKMATTNIATAKTAEQIKVSKSPLPLSAEQLYQGHCQSCHGLQRMGGIGPTLYPENLARLRKKKALAVINHGRAETPMPAFSDQLSKAQIQRLVDYIYSPSETLPVWDVENITASRQVFFTEKALGNKPLFTADPMNLFMVIEHGDSSATLLDGDTFTPITRFKTRFALHGSPRYSPDGRFVYLASRDGWISKYDIYNKKTVSEVRAGINTRNMALSSDGQYLMVGNYVPHNAVILSAESLAPIKVIPVSDQQGKSSRVSAIYNVPPRHSFIIAFKDISEIWEIPYSDKGGVDVYKGWAHDYREDSGEGKVENWRLTNPFPIRRIPTDGVVDNLSFDDDYINLIGVNAKNQHVQIINLDTKKTITSLKISGKPHTGAAISWSYQGKKVLAIPNLKESKVSIIDMENWQLIKDIKTMGPGFFMRSHKNSRYAWVDVFFGPNKDKVHVINQDTLEIETTLTPEPGIKAAHVEFTQNGQYALLSIWDKNGALVVYDAKTLKEVTRVPMNKPYGKYNVFNKVEANQAQTNKQTNKQTQTINNHAEQVSR